ncbi:MAG: cytochrome c [Nitrospiraceae bacterium]
MRTSMVIGLLLASVGAVAAQVSAQDSTGNVEKGKAIYQKHCLRCHGPAGDGRGPDANDLIVPPKNFQSPQSRAKSEFELLVILSNGVIFSPMHSWRDKLNQTEMLDVIRYIRTLAPSQSTF